MFDLYSREHIGPKADIWVSIHSSALSYHSGPCVTLPLGLVQTGRGTHSDSDGGCRCSHLGCCYSTSATRGYPLRVTASCRYCSSILICIVDDAYYPAHTALAKMKVYMGIAMQVLNGDFTCPPGRPEGFTESDWEHAQSLSSITARH